MRTRKLIARNAHAITRCARVLRVRKSAHLNESEQNYAYFSTRDEAVLLQLHEAHPGVTKMKSFTRLYVWWPGLDKEIEKCVN